MAEQGGPREVQMEGLVAFAHCDAEGRPSRVTLKIYREQPNSEPAIAEVSLGVSQVERLGNFFAWLGQESARGRRRPRRRSWRSDNSRDSRSG
ncbi:MAG: hypothetical protein HY329_26965 [Chloroflexi bacterium]|nr:hypothetical protein [Chloroflexota bacterium]